MAGEAVPKTLEIRLWVDLTGGGNASEMRVRRVVDTVRQAALDALEDVSLTPQEVGGEWTLHYPQSWDAIAPLGRRGRRY